MFKFINKILSYIFDFSSSEWHHKLFIYSLYISYILFFIAFTGIIFLSPNYLTTLEYWIKYYVFLILLIRFNPFIAKTHSKTDTEFDRRIVFSAAFFLLLSTSFVDSMKRYIPVSITHC